MIEGIGGLTGGLTIEGEPLDRVYPLIGCIDPDLKKVSDADVTEALILVKLRSDYSGLAVSQIARFLKRYYRHLSKSALIKRIHRALDKLEEKGLVITEIISSFRFARLTEKGLASIPDAVDLIRKAGLPETCIKRVIEKVVKGNDKVLVPMNFRASQEWWFISQKLLPKAPEDLTKFDKELLALTFETWKDNVREKVLVFADEDGNFYFMPYQTRFTSEKYVKKLLAKHNYAWKKATEKYDVAVFVTITLPPVLPLYIQKYAMSFLWHRIKAYLRKHYGFTPPHIYADEPQKCLSLHRHGILFGISRIMDKREFTIWLDQALINFLSNMGHHIQKTVNNRLTDEQVKALNKLGKKLLKRYLRYKRKHPKFTGPINYICKLVKRGNRWEWENPPPDYLRYLEEKQKQKNLAYDGASISPSDYIKKYLVKNLEEILEYEEQSNDDGTPITEKKKPPDPKLAWYWLMRVRFHSVSPEFRMKIEKESNGILRFVGSFKRGDICDYLME